VSLLLHFQLPAVLSFSTCLWGCDGGLVLASHILLLQVPPPPATASMATSKIKPITWWST
jgi:hypothetical protein